MSKTATPTNFDAALANFVVLAQAMITAYYTKAYPNLDPGKLETMPGLKYVRVVKKDKKNDGSYGAGSAWCFVEVATGDVLKCDGWKRPAKHARGNIYGENPVAGCTVYGPEYLPVGGKKKVEVVASVAVAVEDEIARGAAPGLRSNQTIRELVAAEAQALAEMAKPAPASVLNPDGSYTQVHPLFRGLSATEVKEFQAYASTSDPASDDWSVYHPVCREIWTERGLKESA